MVARRGGELRCRPAGAGALRWGAGRGAGARATAAGRAGCVAASARPARPARNHPQPPATARNHATDRLAGYLTIRDTCLCANVKLLKLALPCRRYVLTWISCKCCNLGYRYFGLDYKILTK